MPRPAPGLGSVGEALHRILSSELPEGITAGSGGAADALRVAARRLRRDVRAMIERDGVTATAEALGCHRDTLATWRRPGGWLSD